MAELREQGRSLDDIAAHFGLSRPRVRQILRANGGPSTEEAARARRLRAEGDALQRSGEIFALWRGGLDADAVAEALGVGRAACRGVIADHGTDADRAMRRASLATARASDANRYSEADIVAAIRAVAARLERVPSARDYAAVARSMALPSLPTIHNRMGGWGRAVRAAGMQPAAAPPVCRHWTEDACWNALRRAVDELGEIPSTRVYDRHAEARGDLPSSATVRNRLGRWSTIVMALTVERSHPSVAGRRISAGP
jgi:hypothetical protein